MGSVTWTLLFVRAIDALDRYSQSHHDRDEGFMFFAAYLV
jgi:hypothetical protein